MVFGSLALLAGAFLLSRIWRWAGQQTPGERHDAVVQTTALLGLTLFTTLLGLAVAGRDSTVQRRWHHAMVGAFAATAALPCAAFTLAVMSFGR
ncbi:hypothetical protein ACPC54_26085 [Kitasatospora sp. NPDC094028]